jgi:hypothetical protein
MATSSSVLILLRYSYALPLVVMRLRKMSTIVGLRWDPRTQLGPFPEAPEVEPHPVFPEMEVARVESPHTFVPRGRPTKKRKRKGAPQWNARSKP